MADDSHTDALEQQREIIRGLLERNRRLEEREDEQHAIIQRLSRLIEASAPRTSSNARESVLKSHIAAAMNGRTFRPGEAFQNPTLKKALDAMGIDNATQLGKRLSAWCLDLDADQPVEKVGRSKYRMPTVSGAPGDPTT